MAFQTLARGHFTVRRLARTYGKETVRLAYIRSRPAMTFEAREMRRELYEEKLAGPNQTFAHTMSGCG
jgi:hypothetical protein